MLMLDALTSVSADSQPTFIEEKIKVDSGFAAKRYVKGKFLGKGGFAKCYELADSDPNKMDAVKIIPKAMLKNDRAKQKLQSEIKIHKSCHHRHIVEFKHVFEDEENVYILMELCTNQTLNELLKRRLNLTEIEVRYYLAQIVSAFLYLQENRIIHRE
jgi:polo-like kinase 1